MVSTYKSYCRFCHAYCAIEVDVEDGRAVAVRGDTSDPMYGGYTCIKGRQLPERHHGPGRIREARIQYLRALKLNSNYLAGYRNLAIVESMLGHATAAEAAYQALVLRTPRDIERHRDLATRMRDVAGVASEDRSADEPY